MGPISEEYHIGDRVIITANPDPSCLEDGDEKVFIGRVGTICVVNITTCEIRFDESFDGLWHGGDDRFEGAPHHFNCDIGSFVFVDDKEQPEYDNADSFDNLF